MVLPDVKPSTYIKTPITSGLFGDQDVNEGWFMSNVRILIVDDKQLVRDGLRIFL